MRNEFETIRDLKVNDPSFKEKQFCNGRLSACDLINIVENPYYAKTWELEYLVAQWRMKVSTYKRVATYLEGRYIQESTETQKWHARLRSIVTLVTAAVVIITVIILTIAVFQYNIELMIL